MKINSQDVLVVVDVQNDFCPGGALAVPEGDQVIDVIHRAASHFEHIVLTQDWHPRDHRSFAGNHPGRKAYDSVMTGHGTQTLWPEHCVQGTWGAAFPASLDLPQAELILRKGHRIEIDSYSAFFENDGVTATGLGGYLHEREFERVFLGGLAYDFCVGFSALDAGRLGFEPLILLDACRAIDVDGSVSRIDEKLRAAHVLLIGDSGSLER